MLGPAPYHAELAEGPDGAHAVWAQADDGVRLRFGIFPAQKARGTVLLFPGRTEYIEKYGRTATDLVAEGYSVLIVDWRGQGLSSRQVKRRKKGHVDRFRDYEEDLDAFMRNETRFRMLAQRDPARAKMLGAQAQIDVTRRFEMLLRLARPEEA